MDKIFNIGIIQYNKLNNIDVKFDENKHVSDEMKAAILNPTLILDNAYNDFITIHKELIEKGILAKKHKIKADKAKHLFGSWFSNAFLVFKKDAENTDKLLFYMDNLQSFIETNRTLLIVQFNKILMKYDKQFKGKTKGLDIHEYRKYLIKLEMCIVDCEVVNIITKALCGKKDNQIKQITDILNSIVLGLIHEIDNTIILNTKETNLIFDSYIKKIMDWRIPN